ncbi:hypothetical protein [Marinobacter sp.]|uniref:hypothetical protein n=1 Tax=Marinobacter sp. TaxID=50741 RepID=UPI0019ED107F|nr:hypothetical protein [Marinobacter sp.]MBE0486525.1 hypothetical protein [Marinobacter sp.]
MITSRSIHSPALGVGMGIALALMNGLPAQVLAHGAVEVDNAPTRIVQASISHLPVISGLSAIILDAPQPGIMMTYRGSESLIVEDSEGRPLLRFNREGVMANRASVDWPSLSEFRTGIEPGDDNDSWVRLSSTPSFGWIDPRLSIDGGEGNWRIPVSTNAGAKAYVRGRLTFQSLSTNGHH